MADTIDAVKPVTCHEGLAVYAIGSGEPLLLLPYPHGSTHHAMAEGSLAALMAELGRRVITFDPPGAYRSTRPMRGNMAEMLDCAEETLNLCGVAEPVDVMGHSMGGLCALGLAIERPLLVRRLLLVCTLSGWPAALRWSVPHNWSPWRDRAWWQCMWWGTKKMLGRDNLALHKRLDNVVERASFVDEGHAELWVIEPGDEQRLAPPRSAWLRAVRRVDYRGRLSEVRVPALICVGRHDPQTPVPCGLELDNGIPNTTLVLFEQSGHVPFVEEPRRFADTVIRFFAETCQSSN